jgi:hypothetical protein
VSDKFRSEIAPEKLSKAGIFWLTIAALFALLTFAFVFKAGQLYELENISEICR